MSDETIIDVENVSLAFGGVQALYNVSTYLLPGEIFAIIGPNGAGKTCLLNCISRFYTPQEGGIRFKGKDITRVPTHNIAKLGIARTFQNIELFKGMTVLDNIKLGRHVFLKSGILSDMLYWGRTQREELKLRREIEEKIIDLLEIETIRKDLLARPMFHNRPIPGALIYILTLVKWHSSTGGPRSRCLSTQNSGIRE